jgi:hypothetical protein
MNVSDSIGPEGISTTATIGCFALDRRSGARVAITAMHLITDAGLTDVASLRFVSPSAERGLPQPLGTLLRGTLKHVDAAAIELDTGITAVPFIPGIGELRGARALDESDQFAAVRMVGVGSNDVVSGRIELPSVPIPKLDLDDAVLVSMRVQAGDSGAALVDADRFVVGFLKGQFAGSNGLAVFTSAASALRVLECDC